MIPNRIKVISALVITILFIYLSNSDYEITNKYKYPVSLLTKVDIAQGIKFKPKNNGKRIKATFLTVCSNDDVYKIAETMVNVEYRFNSKYHYDWVFLNSEPIEFNPEFIRVVKDLSSGRVKFGHPSSTEWKFPLDTGIDSELSLKNRKQMAFDGIKNGFDLQYRFKVRYWLKYFQNHELLKDYDYYMRIEPGSNMLCDLNYDIFKFMKTNNKIYGFLSTFKELEKGKEGLWSKVVEFIKNNEVSKESNFKFLDSESDNKIYKEHLNFSTCTFFTDFEIGDLNYFRNNLDYRKFIDYIDSTNGIFYETWTDSIIKTIGLSLLIRLKDSIYSQILDITAMITL